MSCKRIQRKCGNTGQNTQSVY